MANGVHCSKYSSVWIASVALRPTSKMDREEDDWLMRKLLRCRCRRGAPVYCHSGACAALGMMPPRPVWWHRSHFHALLSGVASRRDERGRHVRGCCTPTEQGRGLAATLTASSIEPLRTRRMDSVSVGKDMAVCCQARVDTVFSGLDR